MLVWDRFHWLFRRFIRETHSRSTRAEIATLFSASWADLFLLTDRRSPKPHMLKPVPDLEIARSKERLKQIFYAGYFSIPKVDDRE